MAIESVKYALDQDSDLKHRTNIDNVNIMEMVKLCIQANVFQKYDKLYKQVKGVPMGSPISVVIAELTMQYIERDIHNNQNWNVIIWKRYVDDCLVIIKTSEIQDFQNFINTINSNIQFEIEIEQQNSLPFLDIKIHKESDGRLKFSVYRKPTSNDRHLDFRSNNPIAHKISTIKALQRRAYNICSEEDSKEEELDTVKTYLKNNGYPQKLINKCNQEIMKPKFDNNDNERKIIVTAPYIKGATERVDKLLRPYLKLYSKNQNSLKNKL